MKIILLVFLFLNTFLNATTNDKCLIDDTIMFAIAENERSKHRPIGYPYLISFNNNENIEKLGKTLASYLIDSRTIDCKSKTLCVKILNTLIENNITNLDLGAYQINYIFYKIPFEDYFDIRKSYLKACNIVYNHNKKEASWENVAKYHSGTPKYNKNYKEKLLKNIAKYENGDSNR